MPDKIHGITGQQLFLWDDVYGQEEGDKATLSALDYGMHFFLGESKREGMEVPCVVRWNHWTTERGAKKDPFHAAY